MNRFTAQISSRRPALSAIAAVIGLTTAALLGSPTIATAAQPAADAPHATLYYSLRDLTSTEGTRALYARIVTAAQSVCPGWDSRDLDEVAASRECQRQAVARAIGQIGDARLASVHAHALTRRG
jgi:UrcA family protein